MGQTQPTGRRDDAQSSPCGHSSQPSLNFVLTCTQGRVTDTSTSTGLPANSLAPARRPYGSAAHALVFTSATQQRCGRPVALSLEWTNHYPFAPRVQREGTQVPGCRLR